MARSDQRSLRNAPLYIRWAPFRSAYAIELRLELVPQLLGEIERAAAAGLEVGGVLIGSFPSVQMPTLRVEEIELMARRPENGAVYVPHPDTHRHLTEIRSGAQRRGRTVVGLFRSHVRSDALLPSLTDRNLVAEELAQGVFAFLLIEARAPHYAAFFVSAGGQLPDEPSTREFRLDEDEFKSLPEIRPSGPVAHRRPAGRTSRWPLSGLLVIAVLAVVFFAAWFMSHRVINETGNSMGLSIAAAGPVVRIAWDHSARTISKASGASLLIVDGSNRREVKIGPDELRLGGVDYQNATPGVEVTMTLNVPGTQVPPQSVRWTAK